MVFKMQGLIADQSEKIKDGVSSLYAKVEKRKGSFILPDETVIQVDEFAH